MQHRMVPACYNNNINGQLLYLNNILSHQPTHKEQLHPYSCTTGSEHVVPLL